LEELDFQPGAMMEPMEGKEFSVKWKEMGMKEDKGQEFTLGEKGSNYLGTRPERERCRDDYGRGAKARRKLGVSGSLTDWYWWV